MITSRRLAGLFASTFVLSLAVATGQPASPPAETSVTIDGKTLTIKYAAPSVKGRQILGPGGRISKDPTYPVWRTGANSATAFHTDADLEFDGLKVPKGDYTIFTKVDTDTWDLIINKQTGQWGLRYDASHDLGRVKMTMAKPPSLIETLKITLSATGGNTGKLVIEWENTVASATFKVH